MDQNTQWQLIANADWLQGQQFPLKAHTVLGRDSGCDITIPGTHLSRRHAEIAINGDSLLVRDLSSSNGTFINGKKVASGELYPGDQIQFDVLTFTVEGPAEAVRQNRDPNATIMRPVVQGKDKPPLTAPAARSAKNKQWKTKPTSPGNRQQSTSKTAAQKITGAATTVLTLTLVLATLAAVGYLFTQL